MRWGIVHGAARAALVLLAGLTGCDGGAGAEIFEVEAVIEDGHVLFTWEAGSMSQMHVYRCGDHCACSDDGTWDSSVDGDFVWTTGATHSGQPPLNSPLPYGKLLPGDGAAVPLVPGEKYIVDLWLLDWKGQNSNIIAMGCDTFVAP